MNRRILVACLLACALAGVGCRVRQAMDVSINLCATITPDNWFLWWWYGCDKDAAGGGGGGAG